MPRIDLHTHSCRSDGTDTPAALMRAAADAGLDVVALTDHDTFDGWEEAAGAVAAAGVALVRGVEISCAHKGVTAHLLGYLPDPGDRALTELFARTQEVRAERARRIVERLSADFPISWEQVSARVPEGVPVGRPHIADTLVEAGEFPDRSAVFAGPLSTRSPYYVRLWAPDPIDVTALVRAAGGVPVLAHPRALGRQRRVLGEDVIAAMRDAGLFALERDHRDHDAPRREEVDAIARRLGLRVTGSSDYHGTGKPNALGENLTDPEVLAAIEAEGRIEVLRP